jgi:hypothetical protein
LAALRVRSRIFEVLRFGTPITGGYVSMVWAKNNGRLRDWLKSYIIKKGGVFFTVTLLTLSHF